MKRKTLLTFYKVVVVALFLRNLNFIIKFTCEDVKFVKNDDFCPVRIIFLSKLMGDIKRGVFSAI